MLSSLSRVLIVGTALALAGCMSARPAEPLAAGESLPPPPPGTGPHMLLGVTWQVTKLGETPVIEGTNVTLTFEDGRVAGTGGCNRISGGYHTDGTVNEGLPIRFGEMASTMMACPEDRMQQEQRFLGLLGAVNAYTFDPAGDLVLSTADGQRLVAQRS